MARDVKGKTVVVTGGAEGLGLAMVDNFLKKGAKLAIILDINEETGHKTVADLKTKYGNSSAVFYKCNVLTDLNAIYDKIISAHKKIDLLINNAGIVDEKNIKRIIAINVTAVMEWSMKFYEHMSIDKDGSGGTIINVSSVYGYKINPYFIFYHASKFAVRGFSVSLGHNTNFKRTGVRVLTLFPGFTHTVLTANITKMRDFDGSGLLEDFEKHIEGSEWQTPENVGRGAVEIFEKAESGTVWIVEGNRPAEKWVIV